MTSFQLTIALRDIKSNEAVVFKVDGLRFKEISESTRTLKFYSGRTYELKVSSKPYQHFTNLDIACKNINLLPTQEDPNMFTGSWTVDMEAHKRGNREKLQLKLHLKTAAFGRHQTAVIIEGSAGVLNLAWLCKFYDISCNRGKCGTKIKSIDYKCSSLGDGTIKIQDEEIK